MRAIRFLTASLAALAALAAPALLGGAPLHAQRIAIHQYVEHPSLDNAVLGFKKAISDAGLGGVVYSLHIAQAKTDTANQIVNQIIDEKPDLILAVATNSAQATVNRVEDTPILFTAVTDPVSAKLVASMAKPGANVTGTTDMNPVAEQVALIREIQPGLSRLGVIYNAGEVNSVVQVELVKTAAALLDIEVVEAVTVNSAGVNSAAQSLVGKAEAVYIPTDNSVITSYEAVLKVSLDQRLPVYPAEDDSIRKGGVAVVSIDYFQLGYQTGQMAVRILKGGERPGDIPVEGQKDPKLVVNKAFSDRIGVAIPESVTSRAQEIIE
jgi:putative ABC transport system substrate-binding protein